MSHYSPTRPVDDNSIDNDQICEMKEEHLCPFPGSSANAIAGGRLVTFVDITHMGNAVFNDQRFYRISRFISEVSFY
jgi:hypothetical protein